MVFLTLFSLYLILWALPEAIVPKPTGKNKQLENEHWIGTSPYWIDRQTCRWLNLCGIHHIKPDNLLKVSSILPHENDLRSDSIFSWNDKRDQKCCVPKGETHKTLEGFSGEHTVEADVPEFVLDYAPLVFLHSEEQFWPADINEYLKNMVAVADDVKFDISKSLDLHNLSWFNGANPRRTGLSSKDDVESRPDWLYSRASIPYSPDLDVNHDDMDMSNREDTNGDDYNKKGAWLRHANNPRPSTRLLRKVRATPRRSLNHKMTKHRKLDMEGYSSAPAVLILVRKGGGVIDAFWFFFYSFNYGKRVLGVHFGNHIGDWEYCMIRFTHGLPTGIYFSQHFHGQAFEYGALEKHGKRPILYSAQGTHAFYASANNHPYALPFNLLVDFTDRGRQWDCTKNFYAYHYNSSAPEVFTPSSTNPDAPTSWLHYQGLWGDRPFDLSDQRQWRFFGRYHYDFGPEGPLSKGLERTSLCPEDPCLVAVELDSSEKF